MKLRKVGIGGQRTLNALSLIAFLRLVAAGGNKRLHESTDWFSRDWKRLNQNRVLFLKGLE